MTTYEYRSISAPMTNTIKPAPPPKPSHLSSAFTGTLDSEALRSYFRQQSINNTINKQTLGYVSKTHNQGLGTFRIANGVYEEEDTYDEEDEDSVKWGTAKQSQSSQPDNTPTKPSYGKLSDLFSPESAPAMSGSQITVRQTIPSKGKAILREASSESNESDGGLATIKIKKGNLKALNSIPNLQGGESPSRHSSCSSSPLSTQRSRQPSVLSRLSAFSDEEEETAQPLSPLQETPKKKWMHVRDGSAFEHAGPKPYHDPYLNRPGGNGSKIQVDNTPTFIAGPPPIRPTSMAVEFSEKESSFTHQQEQPTKSQVSGVVPRQARALYAFEGEASFNELTLSPGQTFEIINEDVSGGWSLAIAKVGEEWKRGLVPRGWYTYIQDFTKSPAISAEEGGAAGKIAEPSVMVLDRQVSEMPLASAAATSSSSSWLSPPADQSTRLSRSNSGSSVLSPEVAREQQRRWDRSRPASGVGELYSGITEAGSAMQVLTQMHRSGSNSIITKTGSALLGPAIKESELEEANTSKSSFDSDGVYISTDQSSSPPPEDAESETSYAKSNSSFVSVWKPTTLFGGRGLNRFVPFVTSGAEEFILFGKTHDVDTNANDHNDDTAQIRYDVLSGPHGGPSWKHSGLDVFVEVHSPEVQIDEMGKPFTAFVVHSSYVLQSDEQQEEGGSSTSLQLDPHRRPEEATLTSSVYRRFNQFKWLSSYLNRLVPTLVLSLPAFPSASYAASRFEAQFVEKRRRQLQTWLFQVARHPILSNDPGVRFFLDNEEEGEEWAVLAKETQQQAFGKGDASTSLFTRTFHPHFNVDMAESAVEAKQMIMFNEAYQRGLVTPETGILSNFKSMRETTAATSDTYRQLSYSLLRLITGSSHLTSKASMIGGGPGMPLSLDNHVALPPMGNVGRRDVNGATNEERAWCWREGCLECKKLTRSLQGTAESLQLIADFYENHSNAGLFELHDRLVTMSRLNTQHASVIEVHKATLSKYRQATGETDPLEDEGSDDGRQQKVRQSTQQQVNPATEQVTSRCETVVNITTSEMDKIHKERVQDWNSHASQLLDAQIGFYEDIVATLRRAKRQFEPSSSQESEHDLMTINCDGPILPSPYESHLTAPLRTLPILQPETQSSFLTIWK